LFQTEYDPPKLRSNPTNDSSQTYELTVKITTAPSKFAMTRLLLSGDALTFFEISAAELSYKNNAKFLLTLQSFTFTSFLSVIGHYKNAT
jgi:hypothetical protein